MCRLNPSRHLVLFLYVLLKHLMKTILLSLALLSSAVFAEDNSSEKAKELMSVMKVRENVEKAFAQIPQFSDRIIDSQNLSDEEKKKAKELAASSTKATFKEMLQMDWEGMLSEIYAEVFTEEELQGLIDFYKTPVGQKFIEKQLALQKATMGRMQIEMAKMMPKIQEAAQKSIQEAKK